MHLNRRGLGSRPWFSLVKELMLKLFYRIRQNKIDGEPSLYFYKMPLRRGRILKMEVIQ